MEGLGRAAGSGVPITLRGETVILPPLNLKDMGVIEQHLLKTRPNPLKAVMEVVNELPHDLARELLFKAYDDVRRGSSVTTEDVALYLDTLSGLAFSLWVALKKEYGDKYKLDDVYDAVESLGTEDVQDLKDARDQASGVDELGNSTGQDHPTPKAEESPVGGNSSA